MSSSRPWLSSSSAVPPGPMSTASREETTGCLPADQSCFPLSARSPYSSRRITVARACCTTNSYMVVLGISFGSLLAILLILCIIRWYLVQRSASHHEEATSAADMVMGLAKKRSPGLDTDAIAAMPEFVYRKEDGGEEDEEWECAVCLAAMTNGEVARQLPRCIHVFHQSCVDVWLREHSTCPVCRAKVVVRPAAGLCTEKASDGSTSRSLTLPPRPLQRVDGEERDLEAQ